MFVAVSAALDQIIIFDSVGFAVEDVFGLVGALSPVGSPG